jgi:hypothetical protein
VLKHNHITLGRRGVLLELVWGGPCAGGALWWGVLDLLVRHSESVTRRDFLRARRTRAQLLMPTGPPWKRWGCRGEPGETPLSSFDPTWHLIAAFSVRWKCSTSSLALGWWTVVRESWMPHSLAREWKSWYSNWRPLSVVIVCGQPKWDIQPVSRARATVSAVMPGMGTISGQRVNCSTAVRQVGKCPTRSMCMCRKRA